VSWELDLHTVYGPTSSCVSQTG